MISMDEFKSQLLEFVSFMEEPFDAKLIHRSCIQPIDIYRVYDALQQLEDEGKIISLPGGRYVTAKTAIKRWLGENYVEVKIPAHLVREIEWNIKFSSRTHGSIEAFILEALREYAAKVRKKHEMDLARRGALVK